MRLAIIGSREFTNYEILKETVLAHFYDCNSQDGSRCPLFSEIVSGGAAGADKLGAKFSREFGIKLTEYLPDWEKHGKKAGFLRNEDIIYNSDFVLAFWVNESRGTGNSLSIAKRYKKPTLIIYP